MLSLPSRPITIHTNAVYPLTFVIIYTRDWNVLPDFRISSAELSDDCVSKFTSLVRARD